MMHKHLVGHVRLYSIDCFLQFDTHYGQIVIAFLGVSTSFFLLLYFSVCMPFAIHNSLYSILYTIGNQMSASFV